MIFDRVRDLLHDLVAIILLCFIPLAPLAVFTAVFLFARLNAAERQLILLKQRPAPVVVHTVAPTSVNYDQLYRKWVSCGKTMARIQYEAQQERYAR
jgi:hypothetical protein